MCGIVGISYGPEGPYEEVLTPSEILQCMLPASVHRGPHAYGWMYLTDDGIIHTTKYKGRSDTPEALATMNIPFEDEVRMVWLVGHVRYYTHGSPDNMNNNHPIDHGKIVGVHNGVIRNHHTVLSQTGRQYADTEVDSEAIFAAIHKWGHRAGLRRIEGDMVTVYANRERPETLHIARTHGRPLVFVHTTGGAIMFASELGIINSTVSMKDSESSNLSSYRLLRLKRGRIVERVQIVQAVQEWRKFEGGPDYPGVPEKDDVPLRPNRAISSKLSDALRAANAKTKSVRGWTAEQILAGSDTDPDGAPAGFSRPTRPARGYARSSSYKDGDVVGNNKVFYKGLLLTAEEYAAEVGRPATTEEEG